MFTVLLLLVFLILGVPFTLPIVLSLCAAVAFDAIMLYFARDA
jgi:hypothetical protein